MAKKTRRARASERALEIQRTKKFKPVTSKHRPYRVWACPVDDQSELAGLFVSQEELKSGKFVVCEQATWISNAEDKTLPDMLATNDRVRCANVYCLIYYPPEV